MSCGTLLACQTHTLVVVWVSADKFTSAAGGEEKEAEKEAEEEGGISENKGSVSLTVSGQVNPWTNIQMETGTLVKENEH